MVKWSTVEGPKSKSPKRLGPDHLQAATHLVVTRHLVNDIILLIILLLLLLWHEFDRIHLKCMTMIMISELKSHHQS